MTEFKHRQIEVPFLDQTHANFDEWASLVKRMQAERDLEMTTQRTATWCNYCAAYIRPQVMPAQGVRA